MIVRLVSLVAAIALVAFVVYGFMALGDTEVAGCIDRVSGRRGHMIRHYVCSPHLLAGGPREWFVFFWLWSFPATAAAFALHAWRRNRRPALSL